MNLHENRDSLKMVMGLAIICLVAAFLFALLVRYLQGTEFIKNIVSQIVNS